MKVQEVSDLIGLPISTLHYYERIGIITPKRTANNYRDYSEKDVGETKVKNTFV
ncbi:MerR family transcriptional regulator [Enterococcus sp. LJL99]